jgi:RNA polymerase sigma-70 factor (ECF subfamily)
VRRWVIAALLLGALWLEAEAKRGSAWNGLAEMPQNVRGPVSLRPSSRLVHLGCVTLSPIFVLVDEALLERVQAGDISALEALYRSYETVIFNLARRLCGSDADADDVLQDTFVEVSRSIGCYRGEGPLLGWVKRICASKALMRLRRNARFPEEELDEQGVGEPFRGRLDVESALAHLSPATRAVLWLHDVEGYTHEEIASLLKKSVSFSKSQLSRGHARLRALLSSDDHDQEPSCGT